MHNAQCTLKAAVCVVALSTLACGGTSGKLTELQRVTSGGMHIVMLSPHEGLRHGKDAFVLEFRSVSEGSLVDVGAVRGSASMPMPGMAMMGAIDVRPTAVKGRYEADSELEMAGTWRMTLSWEGPRGQGSVTFTGSVQ